MPEHDDKMTVSRPVEPMTATVIGTGDGRVLPSGTVAETPGEHQPNVVIRVVTPVVAISVRFVNSYLQTLVGILTAGMATDVIPFTDFMDLLTKSAAMSLVPAAVGLLKDTITIFTKLEQSHPLSTGSV